MNQVFKMKQYGDRGMTQHTSLAVAQREIDFRKYLKTSGAIAHPDEVITRLAMLLQPSKVGVVASKIKKSTPRFMNRRAFEGQDDPIHKTSCHQAFKDHSLVQQNYIITSHISVTKFGTCFDAWRRG